MSYRAPLVARKNPIASLRGPFTRHVAIDVMDVYLNGAPTGTAAMGSYVLPTTAPLIFWQADGLSFSGLMSDVVIYNRALSPSEVVQVATQSLLHHQSMPRWQQQHCYHVAVFSWRGVPDRADIQPNAAGQLVQRGETRLWQLGPQPRQRFPSLPACSVSRSRADSQYVSPTLAVTNASTAGVFSKPMVTENVTTSAFP
jgi:hypothetical protein